VDPKHLFHGVRRSALGITPLLVCVAIACAAPLARLAAEAAQQKYAPQDVQVVDPEALAALRKAGTHRVDGPLGTVTGAAPCANDGDTRECVDAARQRLREAAAARGANLVSVVKGVMAQSFPPRYSATGELYEVTPRR